MKRTICLYFSMIILFIIACVTGYKTYNDMRIAFLSAAVIAIPSIYSLIPLIKEQNLLRNSQKNRLADSIFTDREEDLEDIIRILNIKEHCIQIDGDDEQCGKSWMAKRLCDYINNQKDSEFKNINIKCNYKIADYIDMDNYTEKEIESYFKNNVITNQTVLIFDNVDNFNTILSKQKQFHFQMIYILKNNKRPLLSTHTMSAFSKNHIEELQRKIQECYPNISMLTQSEINTLFQLTNGNIGRITALLSEQKCIMWIKDISNNKPTEYEEHLQKIRIEIFIGKYHNAKQKLQDFEKNYKTEFSSNSHLAYKYYMILSDCEHMLNNYKVALNILSLIESKIYLTYNIEYEIELQKAHYYKHLWQCNEALEILLNIMPYSYSAMVDSLGIIVAKYFINDLFIPNSLENSLNEFSKVFQRASNSTLNHKESEANKLKRYAPIFFYYKEIPKNEEKLIEMINAIIEIYENENNRLRANAYFIKGEIYRLYKKYEKAIIEYKRCLEVTFDNNIKLQTNLIVYYLIKVKKINLDFELISETEIDDLCMNNKYSHIVRHRIRSIELKDPNASQIQEQFDTRIMPIL